VCNPAVTPPKMEKFESKGNHKMNHLRLNLAFIGALVVLTSLGVGVVWSGRPEVPAFKQPRAVTTARLPIHFEPWDAQTGEPAHFTARGPGYSVLLSPTRMTMNLAGPSRGSGGTVEMGIIGGNQHAKAEGLDRLPGKSNYYIGNDPEKWRRDVPHFARVRFDDVYPGIDVVYYDARRERGGGPARQLEYDFIVEPGADPRRIQLQFQGTEEISLEPDGGLRLRTASGEVRQERPVVYQEIAHARSPVEGRYVRSGAVGVAFEVGPYDRSRPLVIDPKVEYSTYLGGSGDDQAFGIAVGPDGSVYVVGWTESVDFPKGSSAGLTQAGNFPQQLGDGHSRCLIEVAPAGVGGPEFDLTRQRVELHNTYDEALGSTWIILHDHALGCGHVVGLGAIEEIHFVLISGTS